MKYLIFHFLLLPCVLIAQRYDSYWPIPNNNALIFDSTNTPLLVKTSFTTIGGDNEVIAFIKTENVHYCSDNSNIWRNDSLLPILLGGSDSDTNGAFFLPDLTNPDKCYLFGAVGYALYMLELTPNSIPSYWDDATFLYLDTINQGVIFDESIAVTRHSNGKDWWIVLKSADKNLIYKYLFENNNTQNVIVPIDSFPWFEPNPTLGTAQTGQFKFSQSSQYLSYSVAGVEWSDSANRPIWPGYIGVYTFDRWNGKLNSLFHKKEPDTKYYGCEFMPDESGVILSTLGLTNTTNKIQYLNLNDLQLFDLFGYGVNEADTFCQLQLGPDNKVYVKHRRTTQLTVIEKKQGQILPEIRRREIQLFPANSNDNSWSLGLPYFPNYYLGPDMRVGYQMYGKACVGQHLVFEDTSRGHFWREWDFGDGSAAQKYHVTQHANLIPSRIDTHKVVTHTYTQPGTYTITLKIINDSTQYGYLDTLMTKTISISPEGSCTQSQIWTAGNVLHYDMPQAKNLQLVLYNAIGQEVWEDTLPNSKGNFALPEHLPAAVYLIRVFHSNGEETIKWRKL